MVEQSSAVGKKCVCVHTSMYNRNRDREVQRKKKKKTKSKVIPERTAKHLRHHVYIGTSFSH